MKTVFAKLVKVFLFLALVITMPHLGSAQDDAELPSDLDQLIQMKTQLLQEYAELQKNGPEDKAIGALRSIVNIHRKAFQVATANKEDDDLIGKLRNVYGNDGEYLSDELFRRNEFKESATLRSELVKLYEEVLGPDHPSARTMHWKAVAAKKLSTAARAKQISFSVAIGAEPQGL